MPRLYTPTTEQVRGFWASDGKYQPAAKSYDEQESAAEFDRWLNQVRAEAWDEGYDAGRNPNRYGDPEFWDWDDFDSTFYRKAGVDPTQHNPYREAD